MGVLTVRLSKFYGAATLALIASAGSALAQTEDAPAPGDGVFALGQITVTAPKPEGVEIGSETLTSEAIYAFNRTTLDEAVNLIPGVVAGNSGGSRNEKLIFVRGFDRFQIPLSVDGIRVYLPADNRLDFGRFLTPDIAEIQVAKGYASVLDGPGAMGGAVNLVTRKPTKELEAEVRGTLNLGRNAEYAGYNVFASLGTKHDQWYAQASFARSFQDHWDLPGGFVASQPLSEDGGERNFSRTEDWRVNVKVGFTPNATDEYAISYTRQEGAKNAPLHVSDRTSNIALRNWEWPYWNIEGVYFLSTTALGDRATLKTRAYWNKYTNLLRSWDDRFQNNQILGRSFDSPYDDTAYGGSAQLAVKLTSEDTLSVAFHYRRDEHNEAQTTAPLGTAPTRQVEPNQRNVESTYSAAVENKLDLSSALRLTVGASYDWRDTSQAEEYGVPVGQTGASRLYSFPLINASGWNAQGRLDWNGGNDTTAYLSVSSRVRFPTIFERFSSQFNSADPNPYLRPERATNFEIGAAHQFGPVHVSAAVYYSHLNDALVTIRTGTTTTPNNLNRRVNIGSADYYGAEIAFDVEIAPTLKVGGNYSFIHRDFDQGAGPTGTAIRPFQLTDVPDHKGFLYASWRPVPGIEIVPSLEFASDRTTVTTISTVPPALNPDYYRTGAYANAAIRIDYTILPEVTIGIGAKNLFDQYVTLTDGFPEPGRTFFASIRAKY
jgi:iron complex outermembrane recepter protein